MKTLVYANDRAGELLVEYFCSNIDLFCRIERQIADNIVEIDNAMKWGFGWSQGPFEMWDAIGVEKSVEKMEEEGRSSCICEKIIRERL